MTAWSQAIDARDGAAVNTKTARTNEQTDTETLVSFRGVQKTYDGEVLVVKNLNLDIQRGEFLTMLGPSGSGKTTTLMMLAGFEVPTQGDIVLDGTADRATCRRTSATSAWCSRTTRCSRT